MVFITTSPTELTKNLCLPNNYNRMKACCSSSAARTKGNIEEPGSKNYDGIAIR